jgi:hypothetical protein
MLLIGSQALKYHIHLERESPDYDYIATYDEIKTFVAEKKKQGFKPKAVYPTDNGKKYLCIFEKDNVVEINEFEIAWPDSLAEQLLKLAEQDAWSIRVINGSLLVASLNMLYMLKMSHRFKKNSVHFLKTMNDIILMESYEASIPNEWQEWYKAREAETYNYGHPKLNTDKKSFFKDDFYIYDHDDIHRSIKHLELPAYEYYKYDNEQVLCSKKKFFSVNEQVRLYGVLEEAYTLALERSQIPFVLNAIDSDKTKQPTRKWSFEHALMKVCTSITSGYFRSWAWDHYYEVLALYNENYVDRFIEALNNGQVKPFNGTKY